MGGDLKNALKGEAPVVMVYALRCKTSVGNTVDARVIEIPTPRWSTIDAFRFGIPIPEGAPVST